MSNNILIQFLFPHHLIRIEDNGLSAWAYMINKNSGKFVNDVFLYSPIEPESELDKEHIKNGNPPKLTLSCASENAVHNNVSENQFSVQVSGDGQGYCINLNGAPLALIYSGEKRGYSKAISKDSGFGKPWNESLYNELFTSNS